MDAIVLVTGDLEATEEVSLSLSEERLSLLPATSGSLETEIGSYEWYHERHAQRNSQDERPGHLQSKVIHISPTASSI